MFQPNEALLKLYNATYPQSLETLVDFGVVPADSQDRKDWSAEEKRFRWALVPRGYRFEPAMYDGDSGLCPLYKVRLDKGDFQGPTPVDLPYFERVVKQWCHPGQTVAIHDRILEIHVLGDGQSLEEISPPR